MSEKTRAITEDPEADHEQELLEIWASRIKTEMDRIALLDDEGPDPDAAIEAFCRKSFEGIGRVTAAVLNRALLRWGRKMGEWNEAAELDNSGMRTEELDPYVFASWWFVVLAYSECAMIEPATAELYLRRLASGSHL